MTRLDRIEQAAQRATPGPWQTRVTDSASTFIEDKGKWDNGPADVLVVANDDCDTHPIADCSCNYTCRETAQQEANAAYIALLDPGFGLKMCAAIRALREMWSRSPDCGCPACTALRALDEEEAG